MPVCFLCKETITSVNGLLVHFNIKHIDSLTIFKCGEDGCNRKWSSWNSLRSHLIGSNHNFPAWPASEQHVSKVLIEPTETQIERKKESCLISNVNISNNDVISIELSNNKSSSITPIEFKSLVRKSCDAFVAKLYYTSSIPRKYIQSIIQDSCTFLISGHISILKEKIVSHFTALNCNNETMENIISMFHCFENQFDHLRNEYQRMKYFKACGNYIAPVKYYIHKKRIRKRIGTSTTEKIKDVCGYFIPLRQVLQKFFQLPDAFTATISYINSLKKSNSVKNFIQSKLWHSKRESFKNNDIVLPLFVYYDDWEVNNPLGSHSASLGGVYCYIPCLPPECISRLENFFLVLLFKSQDRKEFGNKKTFAPLIEELNFLEHVGITINVNGNIYKIYFVLGLLFGDNLGLHAMCGFVESFRANYTCRFCKLHRTISETTCLEDESVLRTRESYSADVALENVSLTGIKEECIFNTVTSFHVIDNIYVDMMHDIAEGIAHYDMIPIINNFINIGDFNLAGLNYSLQMFDYGLDAQNKQPCIADDFATKSKLKMTASEMLTFCRLFGIITGHLVKSFDDPFWKLYLLLKEIIEFLSSKSVSEESASAFKILVLEHYNQYVKCTNQRLKPKHHNLIHYASVMIKSGPIMLLSVIRLEGFHKILKKISTVVTSRKNILLSIAIRHQLSFCYRLMAQNSIVPTIQIGSGKFFDITKHDYFHFFALSLPKDIISKPCFIANWVNYKGTKYQPTMILVYGIDKSSCPVFVEVQLIIIHQNVPIFVCSSLLNVGLNDNIGGFEVKSKQNTKWLSVKYDNLYDSFPLFAYTASTGEQYVILHHPI
ncbi:uncharacterized protein LOC105204954 isoform X1 [Solenopsis invicta]|uniref:uncharacterized protein LOC105204954 isoform X1 n=1 Tax=Solenopsis invicta TaxID=13686 RepID=UPI00193D7621|nr:uncharacterized protein LOC105204954 isoform X1 [Solenopsis invicta]